MPIEKEINIIARDNLDLSGDRAVKLGKSLKVIETNNKGVSKSFKESGTAILENGGAMGLLSELTGGYAMQAKDAVEALGLFNKGTVISTNLQKAYTAVVGTTTGALKTLRLALVATGIGALIVLVGLIVSALMDMGEATEEQVRQQELLTKEIERTSEAMREEVSMIEDSTKARKLRAEIAGKGEKELRQIEDEAHEERLAAIKAEQTALFRLQDAKDLTLEQSQDINKRLLANNKAFIKEVNDDSMRRLEQQKEDAEKAREIEKEAAEKRLEAWKKKEEERIQKAKEYQQSILEGLRQFNLIRYQVEVDDMDRRIAAEQAKDDLLFGLKERTAEQQINDDYEKARQVLDNANASQAEYFELFEAFEQKKTDLVKKNADEQVRIDQAKAAQRKAILDSELDLASQAAGVLKQLAGKNKTLQKTAVIIENAAAIAKTISNTVAANAAAVAASPLTAGQPFVGINWASASVGISSTVLATKKALQEIGSGGGGGGGGGSPVGGGGGGGSSAPPPQFNIVGQNPNNQLAQSVAQRQGQPVEAFVVSGNMTSAQSLDRNRIETSTLNG